MTSEQIPNPLTGAPSGGDGVLILPAFLQAAVYLAFGLTTVFWQSPNTATDAVLIGIFMLLLGIVTAFAGYRLKPVETKVSQGLNSIGMLLAASAALMLVLGTSLFWVSVIASTALGLASVLKLMVGLRVKNELLISKDWQLEGAVMTIAAVALLIMSEIGPKAVLGTLGGGTIIAGIFLLVGALTLLNEIKKSRVR